MNDNSTKNKIIQAMYDLVAQKGYDKASIGQIADSIGIQKASIYYYFASKEEIFLQLVKKLYSNEFLNNKKLFSFEQSQDDFCCQLIFIGEEFIDSYFANHNLRKVYAEIDIQTSRITALQLIVNESNQKFTDFLIKCLTHGVSIGAFKSDFDVMLNAQILYAILVGIDQAILYQLPIEVKAVWKEIILKLFSKSEII